MTTFEQVIREFHQRRIEKEIYADQIKEDRLRHLQELAQIADCELKQRRRRSKKAVWGFFKIAWPQCLIPCLFWPAWR